MIYPNSINFPEGFERSKPPDFDGLFDWDWAAAAFADLGPDVRPTDIDGVYERGGHILVFETKDDGIPVKQGQLIMLKALFTAGFVTIFFIWGKLYPREIAIWPSVLSGGEKTPWITPTLSAPCTWDSARDRVMAWRKWAEANPRNI